MVILEPSFKRWKKLGGFKSFLLGGWKRITDIYNVNY